MQRISIHRSARAFGAIIALAASNAVFAQAPATTVPATTAPATAAPGTVIPAPTAPLDDAWYGAWLGDIGGVPDKDGKKDPNAFTMPVAVVVRKGAAAPLVEITALRAGAFAKIADDVAADGKLLGFTLDSAGRKARFEGGLQADGLSVLGGFAFLAPNGSAVQPSLLLRLQRTDLATEQPNARVYKADFTALGQKIPMMVALAEGPHGWCGAVEIASQGIRGLAIHVTRTEKGFKLGLPVGAPASITLDADLTNDPDAKILDGTFAQGAFSGPIHFVLAPGEHLSGARRAQDPIPPLPYRQIEVRVPHPAGHVLAGTLSMPASQKLARDGKVPAVLLVTGSGAQNRDEELLGHRPFAVIADALLREGVAVLRCDDRGIGASTGSFNGSTTLDFASDADAASSWLKKQAGIDGTRVGIIGHSEGAMIAPIVAMWQNAGDKPESPLAFCVLLAAPIEPGGATLTRQTARLYEAGGVPADKAKPAIDAHRATMRAMVDGVPAAELRPKVDAMVRAQLALGTEALSEDVIKQTVDNAMVQLTDPWMTQFIRFDGRAVYARLETPTLAMFGGKDVQVVADANQPMLADLAKKWGCPVTIRRYDGLNHLFQPANTGSPDEYGVIETTFDPKALAEMAAWVADTAAHAPAAQIPEASRPTGWSLDQVPERPAFAPEAPAAPVAKDAVK